MHDPSWMSNPPTSPDTPSATSSPESAAGVTPCASPDGATTDLFGRVVAPVNPSRPQAPNLAAPIPAIFGQRGIASSASAALQSSLVSRLKQRLGTAGLTLFAMTWSEKATPSGRSVCLLRASGHRTLGNGSGLLPKGWTTPCVGDDNMSRRSDASMERYAQRDKPNASVAREVKLIQSSWPSPKATNGTGASETETRQGGADLQTVALASWPTPNAGPQNDTDTTWEARREALKAQHKNGNGFGMTLGMASQLSAWPTPNTPSGGRSVSIDQMDATGRTLDGKKHTASLEHAAKFTAWPTPKAEDSESTGAHRGTPDTLTSASRLSSWATPAARDSKGPNSEAHVTTNGTGRMHLDQLANQAVHLGPISSGSPAETAKPGQLNPGFSRWLMNYPISWDIAAMKVPGRSSRSSRKPPIE